MKEIKYFYRCRLLNDNDLDALKKELLQLLDKMAAQMSAEHDDRGNEHLYYLSFLDIDELQTPSSLDESNVKRHFDGLKKYTALISLQNEILRLEFLEKQRMLVKG